jgi:hypothetical protein
MLCKCFCCFFCFFWSLTLLPNRYPYETHTTLFTWLTDRPGTPRSVVAHLMNCVDDDLPVLTKERTKFSYRNGVYDAVLDRFYPYVRTVGWEYHSSQLGPEVVTCNYLDYDFDFLVYSEAVDPYDIATPSCQVILDSQSFDKEVCRWSYASIGRMIFKVGQLDNWQYFPFYKGTAGSGKSTLLNLASEFFSKMDVGALMSEGQRSFSVEHLFDKYVFFCMDCDQKMTLSQTRWNQMVSGEMMAVERKFKIPLQMLWTVTGAFAGNGFPPWIDQAGNVSRRLLVFLFEKVVRNVDPTLFAKCKLEMPAFMKKCVACYHELRHKFGHKGIWDSGVLPEGFHRSKKIMQAETNPLQAFLEDECCKLAEGESCTFQAFRDAYTQYCQRQQIKSIQKLSNTDFIAPVFQANGLVTHKPPEGADKEAWDGYTCKYILGVSLK